MAISRRPWRCEHGGTRRREVVRLRVAAVEQVALGVRDPVGQVAVARPFVLVHGRRLVRTNRSRRAATPGHGPSLSSPHSAGTPRFAPSRSRQGHCPVAIAARDAEHDGAANARCGTDAFPRQPVEGGRLHRPVAQARCVRHAQSSAKRKRMLGRLASPARQPPIASRHSPGWRPP